VTLEEILSYRDMYGAETSDEGTISEA
jgi:hypothetical protein